MTSKGPKPLKDGSGGAYYPREKSDGSSLGKGKAKGKPKARIFLNMWAGKGRTLWTYHAEKKVKFNNLSEARVWASKHGYDGIEVESVLKSEPC